MSENQNNPDNPGNTQDIFREAELKLNIQIPETLKNLLIISGFENESIIATFNDENFLEIETFARAELHQIIDPAEYNKYYGVYCNKPTIFKIAIGHRNIINVLRDFCKKKQAAENKSKRLCDPIDQKERRDQVRRKKIRKTNWDSSSQAKDQSEIQSVSTATSSLTDNEDISVEKDCKPEEHIFETIRQWTKNKVNVETWNNTLKDLFRTISISILADGRKCLITCFCKATYTISKFSKQNSYRERWIYSNFQQHLLKKHMNINESQSKPQIINSSSVQIAKNQQITSFFTKTPKVNIIQDIRICNPKYEFTPSPELQFVEYKNNSENVVKSPFVNSFIKSPIKSNRESNGSLEVCEPKSSVKNSVISQIEDNFLLGLDAPQNPYPEKSQKNRVLNEDKTTVNASENLAKNLVDQPHSSGSLTVSHIVSSKVSASTSKWKHARYQRCERKRRSREAIDPNQPLITNFLTLPEKVYNLINITPGVTNELMARTLEQNSGHRTGNLSVFLKKLLEISQNNLKGPQNKNFYDTATKKFALYIFYVGGRLLYETLHANLSSSLPSISTLNRFLATNRQPLEEGEMDFEGLLNYLEKRNLPKIVWIAEDATRVTSKIEYDSKSNRVVGFTLPLKNGLPVTDRYIASSAQKIEGFFKSCVKSHYAYVITAQPVSYDAPAYCVSVFGTDNKFTADEVRQRWKYFKQTATKFGITVLGFSSDGDSRLLKAMRVNSVIPTTGKSKWEWYHMDISNVEECYIQDTVHIITKLRTRLLKPGIVLPIGNYFISVNHLYRLIEVISKDRHLLTKSDLKAEDKMNYRSGDKICSKLVTDLLKDSEELGQESKGTVAYLNLMRRIISSFLDDSSDISSRLFDIWFCVFFLRIWRASVRRNNEFTLKNNFLSSNCYLCIELNAHNLVKLILMFKDTQKYPHLTPDMICLSKFSSQACEKLFRSARSITSTFSTVINFSIKGFLERTERIKMINTILSDLSGTLVFPREGRTNASNKNLPTAEFFQTLNIEEIIVKSLNEAIAVTKDLGIELNDEDWLNVNIPCNFGTQEKEQNNEKNAEKNTHDILEEEIDEHFILEDDDKADFDAGIQTILNSDINTKGEKVDAGQLRLRDYSSSVQDIDENSRFIKLEIAGKTLVIKKSAYIWLLDESDGKISNDRIRRFVISNKSKNYDISRKREKKSGPKKTDNRKRDRKEHPKNMSTLSDSSSTSSSQYSLHDTTSDEMEELTDLEVQEQLNISLEAYFAVFYDHKYYIGRVVEKHNEDIIKIKFLKQDVNDFIWPKVDDVALVKKKFVFYGPINLLGTGPFQIRQSDRIMIEKQYKQLKKKLKI